MQKKDEDRNFKLVCADLSECQYGKIVFALNENYENQADFWLVEHLDGWFLPGKRCPSNDILIIEFQNSTVVVGCLDQYKTYVANPIVSSECEYYFAQSYWSESGEDSYGEHVPAHESMQFGKDMDNISCNTINNRLFKKLYRFVKKHMKQDERPIYHFPQSRDKYGYFDINQDDFQLLDRNGYKYQSKLQKKSKQSK